MRIAEIDGELRGYTVVLALEFTADTKAGTCDLILRLAKDESPNSDALEAEFSDVGQLALHGFGGGLTQVLYLRVLDVSDEQLERVKLRVEESERDAISFGCRSARILRRFGVE